MAASGANWEGSDLAQPLTAAHGDHESQPASSHHASHKVRPPRRSPLLARRPHPASPAFASCPPQTAESEKWYKHGGLWPAPRLVGNEEGRKMTWSEAFFDLIFVIAIARMSQALRTEPSGLSPAAFVLYLCIVWR